jgi:diguanylate cyclase (GGDEF)-like protein/PAS domain S-box-containing protein
MLGLVIATSVPFTALIGVGLWNQWRSDQAKALERALAEARIIAAQVDDHIGNMDNLMTGLSRTISWDPADATANDAVLRKVKTELPPFVTNIAVFLSDGTNIGTSSRAGRIFVGDRNLFQQVLAGQQLLIGELLQTRRSGQWVVMLVRPLKDDTGRLRAVLAVGTLLKRFHETLGTVRLPPDSVVQILDARGTVIARSVDSANWIGRDISTREHVARQLTEKESSEVMTWADGVERITGSTTANKVPWQVSVGLPTDVANATVLQRLKRGALFATLTVLLASLIAWMLSGRIVGPLRQLRKDASLLASGKLSHRSMVQTRDDIGVLASAFNHMAERLEQRRQEAQQAATGLQQANDTLAAVIAASPVAIICTDLERRIFQWGRSGEQIFGYTAEEALGRIKPMVSPDQWDDSQRLFERVKAGETLRNLRLTRTRKDGTTVEVRAAFAPMYNPDGTVRGIVRVYEDITDYVRAEEQLNHAAHHDPLTGLPNRLTLQKELGRLLCEGGGHRPNAIALFDLDGFKDINDTLGHSTGDQLLINVGQRLREVTDDCGQVCRLGGDEFVVIIPGCGDPLVIRERIETMMGRLSDPYEISDQILHIAASAGVAIAPADGSTVDELIANADLALYLAKSHGGHDCRFFQPVMRARAQARRSLGLELRRACAENEFELHFQPQIRLTDQVVVGAEALIRWRHPKRGILAPSVFIDALAASPIISEVSRWIIRTACDAVAKWRIGGLDLERIGINLFPHQLRNEALLKDVDDALIATGLPASVLELEITENIALNFDDTSLLQKLIDRGVQVALDDFGTGYASMTYLTRYPLSRIKIDRSFVAKITANANDAAIVRSLIAMAHNLGLKVIAEGVELREQAAFLLNEHCEEAQGYLYAKPLAATDFEAFLKAHGPKDAAATTPKQASAPVRIKRQGRA